MEQISLFEIINAGTEPKLIKGERVYRMVLNIIESGVISMIWKCAEDTPNPYYGYSAREDRKENINTYFTFYDQDIGVTILTDREDAQKRAGDLKDAFEVIEAEDMSVIETIGYRQKFSNGHISEHYLAVLQENMIYKQICGNYPFLYKYKSKTELRCDLGKMKNEIEGKKYIKTERAIIEPELENMYLTQGGIWSSYKYAIYHKVKEKTI